MIARIRRLFKSIRKWLRARTYGQSALIGFGLIIFVGSVFLILPISCREGHWTDYLTAFFTAVSAVCVTGLIVVPTGTYWSVFGQIVIIFLIEVGGLGYMTFMSLFIIARRKPTFHERQMFGSSVSSESTDVAGMTKTIFTSALLVESIGMLILSLTFMSEYGTFSGIYLAFWHSISMFCNAGFDLMDFYGQQSFSAYNNNPFVIYTIVLLIVIGGIGFAVNSSLYNYFKDHKRLSPNTKAVLITTAILLIFGSVFYFLVEYNNPLTLGPLNLYEKINASIFQAVTPRTAGAFTIDQHNLKDPSIILTDILMFIGASPGSTGGGIKTTTIFVIVVTLASVLLGKQNVTFQGREILITVVKRAMCIFLIGIFVVAIIFFMIMMLEPDIKISYILYEILSAYGTVGLTCGITADLCVWSKLLLTFCMFIGRIGPLTIAYVITNTEKRMLKNQAHIKYPPGNIEVG